MAARPKFRAPVSKLVQGVKPLEAAGFYGILSANHCNIMKMLGPIAYQIKIYIAHLQSVNITRTLAIVIYSTYKGPSYCMSLLKGH